MADFKGPKNGEPLQRNQGFWKTVLAWNGKRVYKIKWSKRAGKQRQIWPIIGQGWASNGKDGRTWEGVSKSVMPHSARCARLARRFGASKRRVR